MSYCSVSDVRAQCPEVTADDVSDSSVSRFIAEATGVINDTLRHRYVVPFAQVPPSIVRLCAHLASYYVIRSFPDRHVAEDLERLSDDIRWELESYASGRMKLDDVYEVPAPIGDVYFAATRRSPKYRYTDVG